MLSYYWVILKIVVNFYLKIIICLFAFQHSYSQDSILVKSVVDTTSIKVGEQFSYEIKIAAGSSIRKKAALEINLGCAFLF